MSTFNELIDFTRSTTGTYLDSVVYGPELVTNGTFDSNVDGWPVNTYGTIAYSNGTAILTNTDGVYRVRANQAIGTEVGKTYVLTYSATGNYNFLHIGSEHFNIGIGQDGPHSKTFVAVSNNTNIQIGLSTTAVGFSSTFDNISVKEVIGGQVSGTPLLRTAAINEPRLEYDASGNPLGLLIEEARTNAKQYSEVFTTGWTPNATTVTSNSTDTTAPDSTNNATKLQVSNAAEPRLRYTAIFVQNVDYAFSVFAKAGTSSWLKLRNIGVGNGSSETDTVWFNLSTGSVGTATSNLTPKIESVGNGWYRCSISGTVINTSLALIDVSVVSGNGLGANNTVGDNIYIYGAQLETGSFPTSYIPTSGSAVTRAADVASLPVERFAYNDTKGSVVVSARPLQVGDPSGSQALLEIGTANRSKIYLFARLSGTSESRFLAKDGSIQADLKSSDFVGGSLSKMSAGWAVNNFAMSMDGGAAVVDTAGAVMTGCTIMGIGTLAIPSTNLINGHIKQIQYYPKRLSNEELELLTQPSASPTMNLTFDGQATSTLVEGLHD